MMGLMDAVSPSDVQFEVVSIILAPAKAELLRVLAEANEMTRSTLCRCFLMGALEQDWSVKRIRFLAKQEPLLQLIDPDKKEEG